MLQVFWHRQDFLWGIHRGWQDLMGYLRVIQFLECVQEVFLVKIQVIDLCQPKLRFHLHLHNKELEIQLHNCLWGRVQWVIFWSRWHKRWIEELQDKELVIHHNQVEDKEVHLEILGTEKKLDPKWVPERAKHSGRKIWHEMKGPWRLSPIEHNPKITNLFSRRAFLVTPRWWRSTWRFPITDHSWNVDLHARKSKRGRRANVKSNNSRQISQVK